MIGLSANLTQAVFVYLFIYICVFGHQRLGKILFEVLVPFLFQKCRCGWVGWKSLWSPPLRALLCGANKTQSSIYCICIEPQIMLFIHLSKRLAKMGKKEVGHYRNPARPNSSLLPARRWGETAMSPLPRWHCSGPPDGHPAAFVGGGAPPCVCFWDCNCQRLNKSLLQLRLACTGSGSSIAGSAQGSCQQKTSCLCLPFWRQLLPPCLDCLEGIWKTLQSSTAAWLPDPLSQVSAFPVQDMCGNFGPLATTICVPFSKFQISFGLLCL